MSYKGDQYLLGAIYLNLTDHCNLKCRHCWQSPDTIPVSPNLDGVPREYTKGISIGSMKDVINQAMPLGLHTIKLTGGEPFLRSDVMDFISLFYENDLNVDIETNGTLIDESIARRLKEFNVSNISVSIDSPSSKEHDLFRGVKGAFAMTVTGIKLLQKYELNTQLIMALGKDNAGEIEGLVELAIKLGVQSLKINPIMPIGRGDILHSKGKVLSTEELLDKSRWIREGLQPGIDIPIYFDLPTAFLPFTDIMEGNHPECPILNILGIVENGDISFCGIENIEEELVMGNINRDRIDTIWLNHPILKKIREAVPAQMEGICGLCFFKKVCLGSCRACAYHQEKSLTAPHWFCRDAAEKGLFPLTRYHH